LSEATFIAVLNAISRVFSVIYKNGFSCDLSYLS